MSPDGMPLSMSPEGAEASDLRACLAEARTSARRGVSRWGVSQRPPSSRARSEPAVSPAARRTPRPALAALPRGLSSAPARGSGYRQTQGTRLGARPRRVRNSSGQVGHAPPSPRAASPTRLRSPRRRPRDAEPARSTVRSAAAGTCSSREPPPGPGRADSSSGRPAQR